ncbi:hypothetical protein AR687_17230 [Flavobacteriaceae bacterium CRH]|nr:hypothetical protein AR687_17230 [Flavobacteriaceae bacterium CRH]
MSLKFTTTLNRFYDEKIKKRRWTLRYFVEYKGKSGKLIVTIDDASKEIQEVIKSKSIIPDVIFQKINRPL